MGDWPRRLPQHPIIFTPGGHGFELIKTHITKSGLSSKHVNASDTRNTRGGGIRFSCGLVLDLRRAGRSVWGLGDSRDVTWGWEEMESLLLPLTVSFNPPESCSPAHKAGGNARPGQRALFHLSTWLCVHKEAPLKATFQKMHIDGLLWL